MKTTALKRYKTHHYLETQYSNFWMPKPNIEIVQKSTKESVWTKIDKVQCQLTIWGLFANLICSSAPKSWNFEMI